MTETFVEMGTFDETWVVADSESKSFVDSSVTRFGSVEVGLVVFLWEGLVEGGSDGWEDGEGEGELAFGGLDGGGEGRRGEDGSVGEDSTDSDLGVEGGEGVGGDGGSAGGESLEESTTRE